MALPHKSPRASPATTHCSELEYLIALQSEETLSQLRRSERLLLKSQTNSPSTTTDAGCFTENITDVTTGSPQLFVYTDEECSQLSQIPPNRRRSARNVRQRTTQKAENKRGPKKTHSRRPKNPKRRRSKRSQVVPKSRKSSYGCAPMKEVLQNPTTVRCEPHVETIATDSQSFESYGNGSKLLPILNSSESAQAALGPTASITYPQLKTGKKREWPKEHSQSAQITTTGILLGANKLAAMPRALNRQKSCSEHLQPSVQPENIPTIATVPQAEKMAIPAILAHPAEQAGEVAKQKVIVPTTYSYQCTNLTQTILPSCYPPHFIHQLPPELTNESTANNSCEQMQNIEYRTDFKDSTISTLRTAKIREMCPTPDTTPTVAHDMNSPSPSIAESMASTTPSLSESLAEVFGTKKIRKVLNIEPPQKYLVLEVHLPAIAFMLDVELARLRAVLGMTQRLTPEQLQQMTQESTDVISIHSSNDEDDDRSQQM